MKGGIETENYIKNVTLINPIQFGNIIMFAAVCFCLSFL